MHPGSEFGLFTQLLYKIICEINEKRKWTEECVKAVEKMKEMEEKSNIQEQGSFYAHIFACHGQKLAEICEKLGVDLYSLSNTALEQYHKLRKTIPHNNGTARGQTGGQGAVAKLVRMIIEFEQNIEEVLATVKDDPKKHTSFVFKQKAVSKRLQEFVEGLSFAAQEEDEQVGDEQGEAQARDDSEDEGGEDLFDFDNGNDDDDDDEEYAEKKTKKFESRGSQNSNEEGTKKKRKNKGTLAGRLARLCF
jgi:hypothetical protein